MTNADRFAAALAAWATSLEMPEPRWDAQGGSGGSHYQVEPQQPRYARLVVLSTRPSNAYRRTGHVGAW